MASHPTSFSDLLGNFTLVSDRRYVMDVPSLGITVDFSRVRRERHQLTGELTVRCDRKHARTVAGTVAVGDFNCSSLPARVTRAKFLAERTRAPGKGDEVDWVGILEEFCQRVLIFAQTGEPAKRFCDMNYPLDAPQEWTVLGLTFPIDLPMIWFGDGGATKSYLALAAAAELVQQGQRVLYIDWEFSEIQHYQRMQHLWGTRTMPENLFYVHCMLPLVDEVDRLAKIIADCQVTYLFCDSVAYACEDHAPEASDKAMGYFAALRSLKRGSTNIAHITKTGEEQEKRPFGSNFWHNSARATWFVKRADQGTSTDVVDVALVQRKNNLGARLTTPVGFRFTFGAHRTTLTPFEVIAHPELSAQLPLRQRLHAVLRTGGRSAKVLKDELNCTDANLRMVLSRYPQEFVRLSNGFIALRAEGDDQIPF